MKVTETFLKDCFVLEPNVFGDKRGSFIETFNKQTFQQKTGLAVNFLQDNQSISQRGVLRGLHLQTGDFAQAKLVRVIKGKVLDVAVDFRENSPTFGQHFSIELSGENNKQLFVPRGFLHGFVALEDQTIFSYKVDNFYNKESEFGIIYNDRSLGIDWKLKESEVVLSEKDGILPNIDKTIR
ncbi:dTDP-4-dehydrorhamnose 3,5-epimerase [uncultured Polaribacter sp.]|uniref:dTDP-4-dehydrorhamnose 3,5-epimerase n=1 Tax=uncultured Polaribacter sp. TaxID=174711 RepID=UPI0026268330|nr:dTDP-4-dehydrorhamnose 3,5-epimerase [uncultured Polaribacter sp.]